MTDLDRQRQSSGTVIIRFWQHIPVVIRAILVGFFVFEIGVVAWVFIVGPFIPAPWSILVMGDVLWLYCQYFNGSWWPKTTVEARRNSFRDVKLPAPHRPGHIEACSQRLSRLSVLLQAVCYCNAVSGITSKLSSLLGPLKVSRGRLPDWACASRKASVPH